MSTLFPAPAVLLAAALAAAVAPAASARDSRRPHGWQHREAAVSTRSPLRAQATAVGRAVPENQSAAGVEDEFDEFAAPDVYDPLERVNRAIYGFNDRVYRHAFRPVARGYERVVPRPVRRGIGNFFENLAFPVRFAGSVLQATPRRAARETGKFLVNTTAGLVGFFRVADEIPALAEVPPEDLGQTFARWGVPAGPFLVLPLVGPTTLRDGVGRIGDSLLTPTNWTFLDQYDWTVRTGLQLTDTLNGLPDLLDFYDSVQEAAVDPYVATRNGFVQYRENAAKH